MTVSSLPLERLCIHQVSLMQCDFQASIECLARHGVRQTAVWREKLDEVGTDEARRILDANGVSAVSLCAGGFLTGSTQRERNEALDNNKRWLDQATAIGAHSMVTITGGLPDRDTDIYAARERATEGLVPVLEYAGSVGVTVALEPLHPMVCGFRSVISTLREANDMLDALGSPENSGIALDSYALWWDAELESQIQRAGKRVVNFHVSDWLSATRDVRLDRGMPGDGQIDNRKIRHWLETGGFNGPVEVELFSSQNWWLREPDEVVASIVSTAGEYL